MSTETQLTGRVLSGRCECRAVRYTVADAFLDSANCHCSNCRASTGSAFKPFAGIEREKLEIVEGAETLLVWGDDAANHTRCGICGSLLYSVVRDGEYVHVALGSLILRPDDSPNGAHLRRIESIVVQHHRPTAAGRRVLNSENDFVALNSVRSPDGSFRTLPAPLERGLYAGSS